MKTQAQVVTLEDVVMSWSLIKPSIKPGRTVDIPWSTDGSAKNMGGFRSVFVLDHVSIKTKDGIEYDFLRTTDSMHGGYITDAWTGCQVGRSVKEASAKIKQYTALEFEALRFVKAKAVYKFRSTWEGEV